ncbi:hypothetical protein BGZ65_007167, partial [Modicella reniformis]
TGWMLPSQASEATHGIEGIPSISSSTLQVTPHSGHSIDPVSSDSIFARPPPILTTPFSPALSTATTALSSTSTARKTSKQQNTSRKAPARIEVKSRGKGHTYTTEQETFIAQLVAEPETWVLLDGPGEANDFYRTKTEIREEIAKKVNAKFSTVDKPSGPRCIPSEKQNREHEEALEEGGSYTQKHWQWRFSERIDAE